MTIASVATVKGGLFAQYGSSHSGITNISANRRQIARIFRNVRGLRELATTLNGVAAGSTAQAARAQITANVEQGGKRTIETVYDVNRATVAADRTELDADIFTFTGHSDSPPKNLDRNPLNNAGER